MGGIDGKVTVITGAAKGTGRARALSFVKEGAAVVLTDLNLNECTGLSPERGYLVE